ncbi:MAG: hypothetical protein CL581_09395 [Alteromonadaceae bacterium]|jgi:hypothetical protein|nr:hypothetical protein [Alteromonadaceae bacterium]|tara:strand:- start:350 stop:703 length:354 start_codon:yes stop_codon:yes gene_type:complete
MDEDAFFLGFLARECRFQLSVHFAPKTRIGYRVERRVLVSMKDEPALNMWLSTKGINSRIIKKPERIWVLIRLLMPVKEHVKDLDNMNKMVQLMDYKGRAPTHEEIEKIIGMIDMSK